MTTAPGTCPGGSAASGRDAASTARQVGGATQSPPWRRYEVSDDEAADPHGDPRATDRRVSPDLDARSLEPAVGPGLPGRRRRGDARDAALVPEHGHVGEVRLARDLAPTRATPSPRVAATPGVAATSARSSRRDPRPDEGVPRLRRRRRAGRLPGPAARRCCRCRGRRAAHRGTAAGRRAASASRWRSGTDPAVAAAHGLRSSCEAPDSGELDRVDRVDAQHPATATTDESSASPAPRHRCGARSRSRC